MADILYLKYNVQAKPVLADRDGEVLTNWADGGTHSVTADATYAKSGTKSFKMVSTDAGDFTTNYISLASGNNSTFVVGKKYCVTIWVYAVVYGGVNNTFQIKTGGVTSEVFTTTVDVWTPKHFVFTALSETTALQIINTIEDNTRNIWFELEPVYECVDLTVLAERGMTEPDQWEYFPPIQVPIIDGRIVEQIKTFRRIIDFNCAVVAARADRHRVLYWSIDNDRVIDYLTEAGIRVVHQDISGMSNEWLYNCMLMRKFSFSLKESTVRTTFPVDA